jgi:hypothetical protein
VLAYDHTHGDAHLHALTPLGQEANFHAVPPFPAEKDTGPRGALLMFGPLRSLCT